MLDENLQYHPSFQKYQPIHRSTSQYIEVPSDIQKHHPSTQKYSSILRSTIQYIEVLSHIQTVAARHVLNVGGRHTTFSYSRPLDVFSLA